MRSFLWIIVWVLAISVPTRASLMQAIAKMLNLPLSEIGECAEDSNLTSVDMSKMESFYRHGGLDDQDIESFHINFGCFVACALEKAGIMLNEKVVFENLVHAAERNNYRMEDSMKWKLSDCVDYANLQEDACRVGLVLTTCFLRQLKN